MTRRPKLKGAKAATVRAVAVEICCPECEDADPIPARDGSFMWDRIPEEVTCPQCGQTFKVAARIAGM